MILWLQPLQRKCDKSKSGAAVAHWSMFGDQRLKRKGISKESDKAASESGEAKLLDAVAMLTLNLESERRTTAHVQNTMIKLRKGSERLEQFVLQWHMPQFPLGRRLQAAKNKGEQYQRHPQGERSDALLRLLLWRVAQLITDEAVKTVPSKYCSIYAQWAMRPRPPQMCGPHGALPGRRQSPCMDMSC